MFYQNEHSKVHILPASDGGLAGLTSEQLQGHLTVTTKDAKPSRMGEYPVWIGHHYDAMDRAFLSENITFIVSLAEFFPTGSVKHLFWPMKQPHPKEDFFAVAGIIERLTNHGERVLVHCFGGVDRSPTTVLAWLVNHRGHTVNGAIELIVKHRPVAKPHRDWLGW